MPAVSATATAVETIERLRDKHDREQHERWGPPEFLIDVAPGASDSFSLEGSEGVHFVTRIPGNRDAEPGS